MMKVFALWKNFYSMFGLWFNILTAQEKRKHLGGGGEKSYFGKKKEKLKGGQLLQENKDKFSVYSESTRV